MPVEEVFGLANEGLWLSAGILGFICINSVTMCSSSDEETRLGPLPVTLIDVSHNNVKHFQRLNLTIFPIRYDDDFYIDAIRAPIGFAKLAYHHRTLIAAVCCRKEPYLSSYSHQPSQAQSDKASLAILTLGVLAPYRERGVGAQLLANVLNTAQTSPACADVFDVYVHVQAGNDDALRFYEAHGFTITERLERYYRRIVPSQCLVLRKPIIRT